MNAVSEIINADVLTPIINTSWRSKKETKNADVSFGGWADMDKTTEEICSDIRESRTFRNRDLNIV